MEFRRRFEQEKEEEVVLSPVRSFPFFHRKYRRIFFNLEIYIPERIAICKCRRNDGKIDLGKDGVFCADLLDFFFFLMREIFSFILGRNRVIRRRDGERFDQFDE